MNPKIKHFLLLGLLALLTLPPRLWAQSPNQAALVIRYGDGQVETRCVAFTEPQITGYDMLVRAGLDVTIDASGMGAAVCAIQGTGCPANDCFCHCQGADCVYWSYWHQVDGAWQYSLGGASAYLVGHGAIEGWSWGPGSVTEAIAPPVVSFDAVCNAPPATPTVTLSPPSPTPAPQVNFWAESLMVNAGICTILYWQVAHVTAVYLDGAGVEGQGARQVCPAQTQTYTLRVTHAGGELQRQVSVVVQPLPPTPPSLTATTPPLPTNPATLLPATVTAAAATATMATTATMTAIATMTATATMAATATMTAIATMAATETMTATAAATAVALPSPIPLTTNPLSTPLPPPTAAPAAVIAFAIPPTMAAPEMANAAALSPTPLPAPPALPAAAGSPFNYAAFGLIFLVLSGALAFWVRRRGG